MLLRIERATALPGPLQGLSPSPPASPPASPRPSDEDALEDDFELPEQGLGYHFDGLNDSTIIDNSTPLRCPEAPRYLDISAGFNERNILDLSIKRFCKPTASKIASLAAAIALSNHKLPIRVARAFASAMLSDPVTRGTHERAAPPPVSATDLGTNQLVWNQILSVPGQIFSVLSLCSVNRNALPPPNSSPR